MTDNLIRLKFTEADCDVAHRTWGCNCGPAAAAATLGLSLDDVREAFEKAGFAEKQYTSPTMMKSALWHLKAVVTVKSLGGILLESLKFPKQGLARIQWEGPWTAPGANPKWAYRQTHWVASWLPHGETVWDKMHAALDPVIFDVNGGLMSLSDWEKNIVPEIVKTIPRADGDWHLTHSWEITR